MIRRQVIIKKVQWGHRWLSADAPNQGRHGNAVKCGAIYLIFGVWKMFHFWGLMSYIFSKSS